MSAPTHNAADPFDVDFDGEDDFVSATPEPEDDPWAPSTDVAASETSHDPFAGLPQPAPETLDDPFAGLPHPTPETLHDPFAGLPHPTPEPADDPFAGLPQPTPEPADDAALGASAAPFNPVSDLVATAEAALGEHPVPRITIHVFCVRPETTELVQKASADRRMERAKTVAFEGGLAAAVTRYQNQPTPSLLIVESLDSAQILLKGLEQLAEVCDPGTKVIVIGSANDISLYRELMRRGVSEYLVPPLGPLQLIAGITALYADPAQPFVGRQIAFCGAKGGSGVSTLAHNVAYLISERVGANTVLVDLDLAFGTAGLDFNQDPLHGIADALNQPDRLDPVLMERMMARCGDHLSLFAAPASLDRDFDIAPETFEEVAQKIRAASPYVVLDLPHAWTPWKRRILVTSDDLVIVAEPDLASLRNAKNIVDLVRAARPNDAAPRVILNKVGVPGRPEIPLKDFGEALGLEPAMAIGFDAKLFGQAANNGQMISEVGPKSKHAEVLEQLARMISRRETAPAPAPKAASFLDKLLKR